MKGVAPIKSEYLVATLAGPVKEELSGPVKEELSGPVKEELSGPVKEELPSDNAVPEKQSPDGGTSESEKQATLSAGATKRPAESVNGGDQDVKPEKKRNRGQNKQRDKFSNKRQTPENRLCKAILCDTICSYGDTCKFSHNIADFLSKKPEDLPGACYNFKQFGKCPYGFACRFAKTHMEERDGKYCNIVDETVVSGAKSINSLSKDNLMLLRKHKYDFTKANAAAKDARSVVDAIVKKNFQLNCVKKNAKVKGVEDSSAESNVPSAKDSAEISECKTIDEIPDTPTTSDAKTAIASAEVDANGTKPVGPVTNEDEFTVRPGEKRTIDFRNKLYLAPLTTVGNLPFRRVCKTYGADITCGEMALATKLLQGTSSEWALIKRHSSEDLFGVQLCGAFADSMSRCTQLLTETCDIDFIDINVGCPIDMIFKQGAGSALMGRPNRFHEIIHSMVQVSDIPITAKIRTGILETKNTAHNLVPKLRDWGISLTTLHGRSREQRYTKNADWEYIGECAKAASPMPFFGGGDILSFEDYNEAMKSNIAGTMLARGALIKPWLFTEIKEQRHWDISSSERLDILRDFGNYGLEHWGSDQQGVETTRRFMLEWMSFLHRYIPVGLLERLPQKINERPSPYFGRDELETLMASPNSANWVKISEMLLGPVPDGFFFIPKHRANSYS